MPKTACGVLLENGMYRFVTLNKHKKALHLSRVRQAKSPYPQGDELLISGLDKALLREAQLQPHKKKHTKKALNLQKEALFPLEAEQMSVAVKQDPINPLHYFFSGYSQKALKQHLAQYGFPLIEHDRVMTTGWALRCFYHATRQKGVLIYIGAKSSYLVFSNNTLKISPALGSVLSSGSIALLCPSQKEDSKKISTVLAQLERALERLGASDLPRTYCGYGAVFFSQEGDASFIESEMTFNEFCFYAVEIGLAYSSLCAPFSFSLYEGGKKRKELLWQINQKIKKITTMSIAMLMMVFVGGSVYEASASSTLRERLGVSSVEEIENCKLLHQEPKFLHAIDRLLSLLPKGAFICSICCEPNQCKVRVLNNIKLIKKDRHVQTTTDQNQLELAYTF